MFFFFFIDLPIEKVELLPLIDPNQTVMEAFLMFPSVDDVERVFLADSKLINDIAIKPYRSTEEQIQHRIELANNPPPTIDLTDDLKEKLMEQSKTEKENINVDWIRVSTPVIRPTEFKLVTKTAVRVSLISLH